jgi:hypothetical protein
VTCITPAAAKKWARLSVAPEYAVADARLDGRKLKEAIDGYD